MNKRVELRKTVRARRNKLTLAEQQHASELLAKRLANHEKIQSANTIALYLANDAELDLTPFIHWCWQHKKQVYLPVLHPFSLCNLLFLHYRENTVMQENIFGILEPKLDVTKVCPLSQLDIICTPLVAFDNTGSRLGMGGGFYDRTLSHWQGQNNLYPIGLAHDCQQVEKVPTQSWDIPLPEIITPNQTFTCY
jgi:5-formyltetrahydrofolate cyclo-ligase